MWTIRRQDVGAPAGWRAFTGGFCSVMTATPSEPTSRAAVGFAMIAFRLDMSHCDLSRRNSLRLTRHTTWKATSNPFDGEFASGSARSCALSRPLRTIWTYKKSSGRKRLFFLIQICRMSGHLHCLDKHCATSASSLAKLHNVTSKHILPTRSTLQRPEINRTSMKDCRGRRG